MTIETKPSLDALLTRDDVASALTRAGFPVKPKTLATKASRGGGPAYRVFSGRTLYRWGDAIEWAERGASAACRNASEHRANVDRERAAAAHPAAHV